LLQIPIVLLQHLTGLRFHDIIESFSEGEVLSPALTDIQTFFVDKAVDIQNGGPEYYPSKKWLNIYWQPDEYVFIDLCAENKLDQFYDDAGRVLFQLLKQQNVTEHSGVIRDALTLNRALLKMPFQNEDSEIQLDYNVWQVYQTLLRVAMVPIHKGTFSFRIDRTSLQWTSWEDWCEKVVWWGHKKGAFLYRCVPAVDEFEVAVK